MNDTPTKPASQPKPRARVALVYQRTAEPDEQLATFIEHKLVEEGFSVFVDRHTSFGIEWAEDIQQQLGDADAVIALLSAESCHNEMVLFQIEHAREVAESQHGLPKMIPVRVNYTGPLEGSVGSIDPLQFIFWDGPHADAGLVTELVYALGHLPAKSEAPAQPAPPPKPVVRLASREVTQRREDLHPRKPLPLHPSLDLEPVGGAVPLNSEFYLQRPVDNELRSALLRYDSIVLIKGARQMGKTSLLARGVQLARERGAKVALTDFQKFNAAELENVSRFYIALSETLADQLELDVMPADVWDDRRGPNVNFERYMRREVLGKLNAPLVWGLDEVDRLFGCPYGSEVFGLFRSWHNERALDPQGPWAGLTLAIAYATEAHLFITDINQSPFNVGTRLTLEDFTEAQVAELNTRYGSPLKNDEDLNRFYRFLGGHPYLVRRGLHELATHKVPFDHFKALADKDEGIYGDHLRRILMLLVKDNGLADTVRGILRGKACPTPEVFYRLRSSGIMSGNSQIDVKPRSQLYATYLMQHLD